MEGRVAQVERPEQDALEVLVERLATHPPHDLAQQDEARVAVLEGGAGRVHEGPAGQRPGRGRKAGGHRAVRRDGHKAGGVGEHAFDRHVLERAAAELPEVTPQRGVELELALLPQVHDRDGGPEGLGQGGDVEDGVERHRLPPGDERLPPPGPVVQRIAAAPHQDHHPGHLGPHHGGAGGLVHAGEVRRVDGVRGAGQSQQHHDQCEDLQALSDGHAAILALC
jgi:hypothetical protein